MKNLIFILFICLANVRSASAQEGWSVGVEVTPNLFWLYNNQDRDPNVTFYQSEGPSLFKPNAINTGISIKYALNERLEIGAGLLYSYGKQEYHQTDNITKTGQ
jgi:hypothetical protein